MQIIAHRGASTEAPENTLSAFRLALEHGVDGIEFDVHFLPSGAWVTHDLDLSKTHQINRSLAELSTQEIKQLDIPSLDDALKLINNTVSVNVEIKSWVDRNSALTHLRVLFTAGLLNQNSIISSFDHHIIQNCQANFSCRFGALSAHKPIDYGRYAADLQTQICAIEDTMCDTLFVKDIHARGMQCWVYTVDEPTRICELYDMQVDGVFSNSPAKTRAVITAYTKA
jgi:glycerophosphoryl diester phosphodiesterase